MEFLDPSHSIYALCPASPLEVTWGFYSPDAAFCYPGGEGPVSAEAGIGDAVWLHREADLPVQPLPLPCGPSGDRQRPSE